MTWPPPQRWPDPDDQAYATARYFDPTVEGSIWEDISAYEGAGSATVQYLGSRVRR